MNIVGLVLDLAGAAVLSYGLIISPRDAASLEQNVVTSEKWEENLDRPPVRDRLRQSRNAKRGLVLLVLGFTLQIIAAWPS